MTPHPARAVPAMVQEGTTEDGGRWVTVQQGQHHVILLVAKGSPDSLIDAAARLVRGKA